MKTILAGLLLAIPSVCLAAAPPTQFWNLTSVTISKVYLAKPGTTSWGPNQCLNDPDKSVDPDERLKLTGFTPGATYDVKLADEHGRSCVLHGVHFRTTGKYAFSVSEQQMASCHP
jgi:hypothetical protein